MEATVGDATKVKKEGLAYGLIPGKPPFLCARKKCVPNQNNHATPNTLFWLKTLILHAT